MITSAAGVFAVLAGICAFFFWLAGTTRWAVFKYFPPLLWIYALPVVLNNTGVLPAKNQTYDLMKQAGLPAMLVLLLVSVDVRSALKVMGRGIAVMLAGSFGIVFGAVGAYALVSRMLSPEAWKLFGSLAGSWIGGTGNMAAVAEGLGLAPSDLGVAILADNVVYVVWLPILLGTKSFADRFNRWAKVDPARLERLKNVEAVSRKQPVTMPSVIQIMLLVSVIYVAANALATALPELPPVISTNTWRILWITTLALAASFSPLGRIASTREVGLALVYVFLASIGAQATLSGLADAPVFVAAAFLWIFIHGAACLLAAKLLRVDLQTASIASAANVGGAASAPVVAAHHNETLVPVAILMAILGYGVGNYLAILAAQLCYMVSP